MTVTDKTDTREIVLDILLAVTRDGEYSHIALKNTLDKYQYLEKRERAFLTKVVEGTLEYQIRIDYIINTFSNTKVHKMKPVIRCILRSAVYQICFLDGVPDSAACNEAVKLAKKRGFHTLRGFVNGVPVCCGGTNCSPEKSHSCAVSNAIHFRNAPLPHAPGEGCPQYVPHWLAPSVPL